MQSPNGLGERYAGRHTGQEPTMMLAGSGGKAGSIHEKLPEN